MDILPEIASWTLLFVSLKISMTYGQSFVVLAYCTSALSFSTGTVCLSCLLCHLSNLLGDLKMIYGINDSLSIQFVYLVLNMDHYHRTSRILMTVIVLAAQLPSSVLHEVSSFILTKVTSS